MSRQFEKTLDDFLLARIEEEALSAQAAIGENSSWSQIWTGEGLYREVTDADGQPVVISAGAVPTAQQAEHIARHDPERVLADCAAKRSIVELHKVDRGTPSRFELDCFGCREEWPCSTLRHLATPWADHPNYRFEWRP